MKLAIGADHGGFDLKGEIIQIMQASGIEVLDYGTNSGEACDYPDYAFDVAAAVAEGKADLGVLICKSGIGMSIAANKVKGIRAALCMDVADASSARRHNHANIMTLSGLKISPALAVEMVNTFVSTPPEGDRHERRVNIIKAFEESSC